MKSILLLGLFVFHKGYCFNIRVDPLVHIDQGLIKGEKATDGDYSSFLGIPYAQVNVDNPFGPPEPAPKLEDIFNAFDGSIKCPQISRDGNDEGTLDCLKLNIYVPNQASSKNPLPVLVWIHGGGFELGFGGAFQPANLVKHGIIIVTVNYRLGPYGFMCLDIPSVPGNQGLKDQYEALRWVRKNIAAFGGNPYKVTLGGESAGSASILYHLYSSKDKLYNNIIVQSDTPQSEGMFVKKDVTAAIKIAEHLGFNTTDTDQAVQFLTKSPPSLVIAASQELNLHLKPCKEDDTEGIIKDNPFLLSYAKKVKNTPVLIGHTTREHMGILLEMYGEDYLKRDPFYEKIRSNFNLNDEEAMKAAVFVRHFYVGGATLSEELIPVLEDFDSDFVFCHPLQRTVANLLEEDSKAVYQYVFSYVGDSEMYASGHASENKYLFQNSDVPQNETDQLMIDRMTTMWSNFVKFGNPTPAVSDLLPVVWEPTTFDSRPYLLIDTDMKIESRVFKDRMTFWDLFFSIYEKYYIFA